MFRILHGDQILRVRGILQNFLQIVNFGFERARAFCDVGLLRNFTLLRGIIVRNILEPGIYRCVCF